MKSLRFARMWLVIGWVAVFVALYLNLMPARMLTVTVVNDKFEHTLGYVLLTTWFCGIYSRSRYWLIAAAFCVMGVLVEVLQGAMHVGRMADVRDVIADVFGIVIGLGLSLTLLGEWPRWLETLIPNRSAHE